jgi:proteasome alpha subunit
VTTPFYTSPEQIVRDRSEYARKGISRGRSVVVLTYADGIAFVAENPSKALHKISEIYDRIAFAAVGKYNEFENLRVAGVRLADMRGYSYDRRDVTGRALANAYAQTLGSIFIENQKPYEVELVVAEVGASAAEDQIYRLTYDGSVADEQGFVVMGGASEKAEERLSATWRPGLPLGESLRLAVDVLAAGDNGERREIGAALLEVAVLDRDRPRRTFRRIVGPLLTRLLSTEDPTADAPLVDEAHPGHPEVLSGEPTDGAATAGTEDAARDPHPHPPG